MAILARLELGHPMLRAKARKATLKFLGTPEFKKLRRDMIGTMRGAGGVGLAAPQVGVPLAIAVMEMRPTPTRPALAKKGPIVIVNPKILSRSKRTVPSWEGCLSLPTVQGSVPRSEWVVVSYLNEKGRQVFERASGLWARIFQHEIDHLNGMVYLDRMKGMKTLMTVGEFKKRILKHA